MGAKTPVRTPAHVDKTDAEGVEVEVERRIPGSFDYEVADDGSEHVGSPVDVVGVLAGLWRRFHVRS